MQYSQIVPKFLKQWEGLRLEPYQDSGGLWTVGYGHLMDQSAAKTAITPAAADAQLALDLDRVQQQVNDMTLGLGLSQCEFDALCCFVFNVGAEAFAKSTMLELLKQGDHRAAANQLSYWDHVNGQVIPGLLSRRLAERAMFLGST
jgi:lysozyme